jgi:hypothetical protein
MFFLIFHLLVEMVFLAIEEASRDAVSSVDLPFILSKFFKTIPWGRGKTYD